MLQGSERCKEALEKLTEEPSEYFVPGTLPAPGDEDRDKPSPGSKERRGSQVTDSKCDKCDKETGSGNAQESSWLRQ